jgi:hypothetical protein
MENRKKTTAFYDVGGLFIAVIFAGIPLGVVFDYLWNLLVISIALPRLPGDAKVELSKKRKLAYCLFITLLGVAIDWAYFELTWDMNLGKSALWIPAMSWALQFLCLLIPMAMIALVNTFLSYSYLKLERKQAIILGAMMAFFTAPWLLPTLPYAFGWVI